MTSAGVKRVLSDLDELEKAAHKAGRVRGKYHPEWFAEIDELTRAGRTREALALLGECIVATERENEVKDDGRPPLDYFVMAATIHRKEKNFEAEIAVLSRYLRVAATDFGSRLVVEDRLRKAWFRMYGNHDTPIPDAPSPKRGRFETLMDELHGEQRKERRQSKRETATFAEQPSLPSDQAEATRRLENGVPSTLLKGAKWRVNALELTGPSPDASTIIDALLNTADRWGVLEPDLALIKSTFARTKDSMGDPVIDLRTGEEVRPKFVFTNTELWLSAATGIPLRTVERVIDKLQPGRRELITFWQIPGDFMEGKAELHRR